MKKLILLFLINTIVLLNSIYAKDLIIYSSRHYDVDKVIATKFYQQTGIKVVYYNASSDVLLNKIELSNDNFDLLMTSDAQTLYMAKEKGFLRPFKSNSITKIVPKNLIDENNNFTAFTKRYRVIAYNNKKVKPSEIKNYLSLGDDKFKGRLALRSGKSGYNIFLVASLIEHYGEDKTLDVLKNMVNNTYASPKGSDRDQLRIIAKGDADLTVINSYYYGLMANSIDKNDVAVLKDISLYFPNTKEMGAHFNVSSIGISKNSKNVNEATQFIEFLLSTEIQELIMYSNYEHPVNKSVQLSEILNSFGVIKDDELTMSDISKHSIGAVKLIQDANWG